MILVVPGRKSECVLVSLQDGSTGVLHAKAARFQKELREFMEATSRMAL